jgi:hypothetical protein
MENRYTVGFDSSTETDKSQVGYCLFDQKKNKIKYITNKKWKAKIGLFFAKKFGWKIIAESNVLKKGIMEIDFDNLPSKVQEILNTFDEDKDSYIECKRIQEELEKIGWTCDYYLDGTIFDVQEKKH